MRLSRCLLATIASPAKTGPLRSAPMALLPPIPLYRRLLRAHRKHLDAESRVLGDAYVKAEYRSHRNIENPIHIVIRSIEEARYSIRFEPDRLTNLGDQIGFLTEWQFYAQQLEGNTWKDERMDRDKIDKMSDEQIGQLYELMQAIQKQGEDDNDPSGKQ